MKRRAQLRILDQIAPEVLHDLGLERAVSVNGVDGFPDIGVELLVVHLPPTPLQLLDDLGEEVGFRKCKKSVDPSETGQGEMDLFFSVEPFDLLGRQRSATV